MSDFCQDTSTASEWSLLSEFTLFEPPQQKKYWWVKDNGVFVRDELHAAPSAPGGDLSTLPGETLTAAVTDNQEQRAVLLGMIRRFAAEDMISTATLQGAAAFMAALPRSARLPLIAPASDGALAMEWSSQGSLGTLLTVDGNSMHYVLQAGSPAATYHDHVAIEDQLPGNLLAAIHE